MILEWSVDEDYHRWFAWRPVMLNGPKEWDRARGRNGYRRLVWLRFVWRKRSLPSTYYSV